jgi:small subunit ribosomal protein S6
MRKYILTLVLSAALKDADRKKLVDTIKGYLKGAKFTKEEEWGEKKLAYKIRRQEKGFYFNFELDLENLPAEFDKKLIANEDVLRYLIIRAK